MKEIVNDGFAKVVKPYMDAQDKKSREIIAPVEVSPAKAAHSAGDQIIFNGILHDVIAPIAINDVLSTSGAGANISVADNIEAQIKATKSQIQTAAAQAAAQNKNTQEMIAPVEEDETDASRDYAIGDQLILDGVLYNVIDAIAQHGIITSEGAGANIEEADDVTDQLSSLNEALSNLDGKTYKTDDAAITEVTNDDLLPIYDTSAAAKKKIAVNNFIGGLVSNPNLLDNPWFTVNQRGIDSTTETWTQNIVGVDRWKNFSNTKKLILTADGVSELEGGIVTLYQIFDSVNDIVFTNIYGKVVTLSVLYADGTIDSGTALVPINYLRPQSRLDVIFISNTAHTSFAQIESYATRSNVVIEAKAGNTIRAIKLELGSVSTLAMDTAPNYATELLKCQRYYQKYPVYTTNGFVSSEAKRYYMPIYSPTHMRTKPTATMAGWYGRLPSGGYSQHTPSATLTRPTSLNVAYEGKNQNFCVQDTIETAVDTNNIMMSFHIEGLELSADL